MQFRYTIKPDWPPLAWVAHAQGSTNTVNVWHARRVEATDDWFGEIVWSGDYASGDFDRTDIVAGSGARRRGDVVAFVSSGSTIDRLYAIRRSGDVWISNSLPALLTACQLSLRPSYPFYIRDYLSLVKGIRHCVHQLPTTAEPVELINFDNLHWNGTEAVLVEKPSTEGDFDCFASYREFLHRHLAALSQNLSDTARSNPYKLLTTVSSGYDSPTIAVLARECGCQRALTFAECREGTDDSGSEIGRILGLDTTVIASTAWQGLPPNEAPFYGAAGFMGEIVYTGGQDALGGTVLLTGYHGDGVWSTRAKYEKGCLVRGDISGLALSEYRLWTGFINCPLPFWGARRIKEIHQVSRGAEMQPWSLPGSTYDRPICRRIVEEAGVPRGLFGVHKKAVGVSRFILSSQSRELYMQFLRRHQGEWLRNAKCPPIRSKLYDDAVDLSFRQVYRVSLAAVHAARRFKARRAAPARQFSTAVTVSNNDESVPRRSLVAGVQDFIFHPKNLHRYVVPWAVEQCKMKYTDRSHAAAAARRDDDVD